MAKPSIIVLGGGIIGALSAYELAKNGADVTLLEKNRFSQGASGNSAAMLEFQLDAHRGDPFFSLAKASHDLFPALHKEFLKKTNIDIDFERCGILQVALNDNEAELLKRDVEENQKRGLHVQWLSPEELKKLQPNIAGPYAGAALFKDDGQVDGNLFLRASLECAQLSGVDLRDQCGDMRILAENGKATGVLTKNGRVMADKIVLAAGAYVDQLLVPLKIQLGVQPIRGQLVIYKTDFKTPSIPIYTTSGGYLTPKKGYTLAGTTVESVGFDNGTTPEGRQSIIEQAVKLFPSFGQMIIEGMKAGLRPKSPDDLPLLGPLSHYPEIIAATGHYRNGILLAPITAKIVSHFALGTPIDIDPRPFSPERVLSKTQ